MDCPRCDSRIRQDVNYCPECGLYVEKLRSLVSDRECPRCNEAVPPDSSSCPGCDLAMAELRDRLFGEDPDPPSYVQGSGGDAQPTAGPPPEQSAPPSQPPQGDVPPEPQPGGGPAQPSDPQGPPPDQRAPPDGDEPGPGQPAPSGQTPPPDGNGPPGTQPPPGRPTDGPTLTDRLPLVRLVAVVVLLVLAGAVVLSSGVLDSGSSPTAGLNDGFLQSESDQTGQQASQQVIDRLEVRSATGTVRGGQVTVVNLTVARAPGSAPIDLGNVSGTWVGPQGSESLVWDDAFRIHPVADDDGSIPVLNDAADRAVLTVHLGSGGVGQPLAPGSDATVRLTTPSNGTTTARLVVPESLEDGSVVQL